MVFSAYYLKPAENTFDVWIRANKTVAFLQSFASEVEALGAVAVIDLIEATDVMEARVVALSRLDLVDLAV